MTAFREEIIGPCRLILGDCLEVLQTLGKVDAVVTDPPYGLGDKWSGGTWFTRGVYENDKVVWDDKPIDISSILSLDVPTIVWGGNYFGMPASRCWLAWVKRDNMPTMADFELAWTNIDRTCKEFFHRRNGWERRHPTEKPIPLMEWCLSFIPGAETILDPFMGSGTTGVACIKTERQFIGIEKEPKYFDIACRRIERAWQDKCSELPFDKPAKLTQRSLMEVV